MQINDCPIRKPVLSPTDVRNEFEESVWATRFGLWELPIWNFVRNIELKMQGTALRGESTKSAHGKAANREADSC